MFESQHPQKKLGMAPHTCYPNMKRDRKNQRASPQITSFSLSVRCCLIAIKLQRATEDTKCPALAYAGDHTGVDLCIHSYAAHTHAHTLCSTYFFSFLFNYVPDAKDFYIIWCSTDRKVKLKEFFLNYCNS